MFLFKIDDKDKKPWSLWRKVIGWTILSVLLLIASAYALILNVVPMPYEIKQNKILRQVEDTEKLIKHVRVGGIDYYIPFEFFSGNHGIKVEKRDVNLLFILPDFTSKFKANVAYGDNSWLDQSIHVSMMDQQGRRSLAEILEWEHKFTTSTKFVERVYDLNYYTHNGSVRTARDEIFVEEGQNLQSFLTCNIKSEMMKFPSCRQYISWNNLILKIRYRRVHLKDWKKIQTRIIQMLTTFQNKPIKYKGE